MTAVAFDGARVRTRLFVEAGLAPGQTIALSDAAAHYLTRVLRVQAGDAVLLFNGRDGEALATVAAADKRSVSLSVDRQVRPQPPTQPVWLLPAVVKRPGFETILRQATELGVSDIQPVLTRHGEPDRVNLDRAETIVREAAEQSERLTVPRLHPPRALTALLADWPADRPLLACLETGSAAPIATVDPGAIPTLLLGPEGGFAPDEVDALHALSTVVPVSLGPRILKADTAAAAALAVVQASQADGAGRPPHR